MNIAHFKTWTVSEYLAWADAQSERRRTELINGQIVAMSPERADHNRVKGAVFMALHQAVKAARLPCEVFTDGMTVPIDRHTAYEPDALVHCGLRIPPNQLTAPAPTVVVEVLSPTSAHSDTSAKLIGYFKIASIRHYLVVDPEERSIVHHMRLDDGSVSANTLRSGKNCGLTRPASKLRWPTYSGEAGGTMAIGTAREVGLRSRLLTLVVSSVALALTAVAAHAQMPAAIAAPGEAIVVKLQAEGAQVYECKPGARGLSWAFREPIATLLLDGKTVGRHYAGPNWEYVDGSGVAGKVAASVPGQSASDIPWLKLNATTRRGRGMLSAVNTIQRIETRGGVHSGPCETAGAYFSAPYSAVYVFLQQGG